MIILHISDIYSEVVFVNTASAAVQRSWVKDLLMRKAAPAMSLMTRRVKVITSFSPFVMYGVYCG